MSQTFLRLCCEKNKEYIAHFEREPSVRCCQSCYDEGALNGAKKIINIKTKEEVSI